MSDQNTELGRGLWGGETACAKAQGQVRVIWCDWRVTRDEAWNVGSTLRAMGGCFDFPVNTRKPRTNLERARK